MTAATQSMPGMNDRLARHFVRRLCREAERRAVDTAVEAGFLREECIDSGGRICCSRPQHTRCCRFGD